MLRDVIREMKASSNGGTSVPLLHQMPHLEQASQLQVGGSHDCEVQPGQCGMHSRRGTDNLTPPCPAWCPARRSRGFAKFWIRYPAGLRP